MALSKKPCSWFKTRKMRLFICSKKKTGLWCLLNNDGEKNIQKFEPRLNGLTGTVALEKKIIIVEDITNHPIFKGMPKTWQGSIIGIPL